MQFAASGMPFIRFPGLPGGKFWWMKNLFRHLSKYLIVE